MISRISIISEGLQLPILILVMSGSGRILLEDYGIEYLFQLCRGRAAYFSRITDSNTYSSYASVGPDISPGFRPRILILVMPGSGRIFLEDCSFEYLFSVCRGRAAYFSRIPASNAYSSYVGVGLDISRGFRPRILILVMSGSGRIFLEDYGLEYLF